MFNYIKNENNIFKNLINGEWVNSRSGNFVEIKLLLNNLLLGRVLVMIKEEVNIVV